jgi:hypothetical protein
LGKHCQIEYVNSLLSDSSITDLKVNGVTQLMYLADNSKNEIIEADMTHPYAERIIKANLEEPRSIVVGK